MDGFCELVVTGSSGASGVVGDEEVVEDEVDRLEDEVSQDGWMRRAGFRKVLYVDPREVYLIMALTTEVSVVR